MGWRIRCELDLGRRILLPSCVWLVCLLDFFLIDTYELYACFVSSILRINIDVSVLSFGEFCSFLSFPVNTFFAQDSFQDIARLLEIINMCKLCYMINICNSKKVLAPFTNNALSIFLFESWVATFLDQRLSFNASQADLYNVWTIYFMRLIAFLFVHPFHVLPKWATLLVGCYFCHLEVVEDTGRNPS